MTASLKANALKAALATKQHQEAEDKMKTKNENVLAHTLNP
jgi:hypothetical protein